MSLLSALDALASTGTTGLLFLVFAIVASAATSLGVSLALFEVTQHAGLGIHSGISLSSRAWEGTFDCGDFVDDHLVWECHFEHHKHVTELIGLLVERKSFLGDSLEVVGLNDLTWLVFNSDLGAIEMGDNEVHSCECLNQSDFVFNQQVSTLALEALMGLLLNYNDNVTGLLTWGLVSFSVESVLSIVW